MILGVSSTKKTGKTTFIDDLIERWPKYQRPEKDYRSLNLALVNDGARDRTVDDPALTPEERQRMILDFMLSDLKENYDRDNHIIHDQTTIDNLAYTMFLFRQGKIENQEFLEETMAKVKESTHYYDVVVFIPLWGKEADGVTPKGDVPDHLIPPEINRRHRLEVDEILKSLFSAYHDPQYKSDFWAEKDCAVPIEVYGEREARLFLMDAYMDDDGDIRAKDAATILDSLGRGVSSKDLEDAQHSMLDAPTMNDFT